MTTFTIVTVTYNAASVVQRTLDSVMAQSHEQVEHIIIDGASSDATPQMALSYKRESERRQTGHSVTIVSEPDRGIYDAMNKGLARATGHYVVFLNAGDFLPSSDTIAELAHLAETETNDGGEAPAVLYGDTAIVDGQGVYLHQRRLRPPETLTWRSFRHGMLVCHQAFYARTDLAKATPYDLRYRLSADVDWCIRIMRLTAKRHLTLANAHATVANYTEQGLTTRNHRASLMERFGVMRRHYGLATTIAMHLWFVIRAMRDSGETDK